MMRTIRLLLGGMAIALVAACGGGSDSGNTPVVPARAGAASIGAAGGTVDAVIEGGATVELLVPAGALPATTTLRIDPINAPAGTRGAVSLSPAGLQFKKPVTLLVTFPAGGAVAADTVLAFDVAGTRIPLSGSADAATRRISVSLNYLGVGAAAPASAAAVHDANRKTILAANGGPTAIELLIAQADFNARVQLVQQLVATLGGNGSRDNAINVELAMASVLGDPAANADARLRPAIASWRSVVCGQQQFAVSALNTFNVASDYTGFLQRASDVLVWGQLAQSLGSLTSLVANPAEPGCSNLPADYAQPVRDRYPAFLGAARQTLGLLDPRADFDQLLKARLPQLLNFQALLQSFPGLDDLAADVVGVVADQAVRLRAGAYAACRVGLTQQLQKELLVREVGDPSFEPASPYGKEELLNDIETCGMPIHWELQSATGQVLQQGEAGGIGPGNVVASATLQLHGADKLVLRGPLSALRCPAGSQNNEQLTVSAGPAGGTTSSVAALTPSNGSGYLEASNLEIAVSQLQALAQPNGPDSSGQLVIERTGGVCNGEFPTMAGHTRLVNFTLGPAVGRINAVLPTPIAKSANLEVTVELQTADGSFAAAPNQLVTFTPTCASVNRTSGRTDAGGRFTTTVTPNDGCTTVSVKASASANDGTPTLAEKTVSAAVSNSRTATGTLTQTAGQTFFSPPLPRLEFMGWSFSAAVQLVVRVDGSVDSDASSAAGTGAYSEIHTTPEQCRTTDTTRGDITSISVSETNGVKSLILGITGTQTTTAQVFDASIFPFGGCVQLAPTQRSHSVVLPAVLSSSVLVEVRAADGTLSAFDFARTEVQGGSQQRPQISYANTGRLVFP